jgi:hypothetical protein
MRLADGPFLRHPAGMTDRRPKNSELRLIRLEEEEANREEPEGILELFERDEDAPLTRDADDDAE